MIMKCVCVYCGKLNENINGPKSAMYIPFYAQDEEETQKQPGAYNLKYSCQFCGKEFYVVWDQDSR